MKFLSGFLLLITSLVSFGVFANERLSYTNINNAELAQLLSEGVPIYDIRREEEWLETGVIENSNLLTTFDENGDLTGDFMPIFLSEAPIDMPVILICRTGNRTGALSTFLSNKLGYKKIYNVEKGITFWKSEGNPVVTIK